MNAAPSSTDNAKDTLLPVPDVKPKATGAFSYVALGASEGSRSGSSSEDEGPEPLVGRIAELPSVSDLTVSSVYQQYGLNPAIWVAWALFMAPAAYQSLFQITSLTYLISTILYLMNATAIMNAAEECMAGTPDQCQDVVVTQRAIATGGVLAAPFAITLAALNVMLLVKSCGCLSLGETTKRLMGVILCLAGFVSLVGILPSLVFAVFSDCIGQYSDALKDEACEPAYGASATALRSFGTLSAISFFLALTALMSVAQRKEAWGIDWEWNGHEEPFDQEIN